MSGITPNRGLYVGIGISKISNRGLTQFTGITNLGTLVPTKSFILLSGLDPSLTFARASSATQYDNTGTVITANSNIPRFDFDPVTLLAKGLLIEEQRTNLVLNSSAITQVNWVASTNALFTSNFATAPDGTLTATRMQITLANGAARQGFGSTATNYTVSIWCKSNTGSNQNVSFFNGTSSVPFTATNTWQRFSTIVNFTLSPRIDFGSPTNGADLLIWGGQGELGTFATSYMPTSGVAVTRAADTVILANPPWYNASQGSFEVEIIPIFTNTTSNPGLISFNNGTNNNRISLRGAATLNAINLRDFSGTVSQYNANEGTTFIPGSISKVGRSFMANAAANAMNGTITGSTASYTMPVGINAFNLGYEVTAGNGSYSGWFRQFNYWNYALTQAQLRSVTT